MSGTLIISEKNKAAQAIAEALGSVQKISEGKYVKVYFVPNRNIYVVPLRGHIKQYENTGDFQKWTAHDPREIITNQNAIEKIPSNYAGNYISALKKYGKLCDTCVIGTDADVEGCNIGIIDALPYVQQVNRNIQIKQLWLNDLQENTIRSAYNQLIQPKWNWAKSGEARAILDAIIGFAATREVSLTLKNVLNGIGVKFASIGRVQTSLLYLLYLREDLIRNFNPSPFWAINADLAIPNGIIKASHVKNNFTQKEIAETIFNKIKNEKLAHIQDIRQTRKEILPPAPLNTSKALLLITKTLKIDAKKALSTLEELYLNKIISYPRTDSDVYSKEYDHKKLLQQFLGQTQYSEYVKSRFQTKMINPRQGKTDAGDHSPITPLISLELNSNKLESELQKKTYDIIARHYLALFGDKAVESETRLSFLIKDEPFTSKIMNLIFKGFLEIAPFLSKQYDAPSQVLGEIVAQHQSNQPQTLPIRKLENEEKETQPPPRYTDTTLLKLMEQKNLGTKSTRPAIIQILLDRKYIVRKSRSIYVTELGFLLIEALIKIWLPFLDPKFTATVEAKLEEVKEGMKTMEQIVTEIKATFLVLFDKFREKKTEFLRTMGNLNSSGNILRGRDNKILSKNPVSGNTGTGQKNAEKDQTTSKCPKCKQAPMKLIITQDKSKKFFVCSDENCKTYLSLPKSGTPRLMKGQCSICGFNFVKISRYIGKKRSEYYMCPLCWNNALKSGQKGGFCYDCKEFHVEKGRCAKKKTN